MTWEQYADMPTRTPVTLVITTLDACSLTFGQGDCPATGEPCYNTYYTCKSATNFARTTKAYEFTPTDAPLPFPGPRPYLKEVTLLPTEIKEGSTVSGRLKIALYDEPDTDVGIDPYVSQRSTIAGTFWKKLLARNPNYKGRPVQVFDGFLGMDRADYVERGRGTIDKITIKDRVVTIECADALKDLSEIKIPPQLDLELVADITAVATEMTLDSVVGLDSPAGYIRIGEEIISYTSVNGTSNVLSGCTRGVFNTTAATAAAGDAVNKVRYIPPADPFDTLQEILSVDCGLTADEYDGAAFDYWRDWPGCNVPVRAVISSPTEARKLIFELADLLDCSLWVGEDLKITIRRNIPNEPERSYRQLTDAANISEKSRSVDLNQDARYTRVLLYWGKSTLGSDSDVTSYARVDIGIDSAAESAEGYGDQIEKIIYCRWLAPGYIQEEIMDGYVRDLVRRRLLNIQEARPILSISVEIKDGAIKTGEYLLMQTDEVLTAAGLPVNERFQVIKREAKGSVINLKALKLGSEKLCCIAPDTAPDYDSGEQADKEYGYISDMSGRIDGQPGYVVW